MGHRPAAPVREKTAREKALEFAKNNVPKPKQRKDSASRQQESSEGQGASSVQS